MRINLLAGGFGGSIGALQTDVDRLYSNIDSTIEDLKDLKKKINNVSGGTGGLDTAVTGISSRIRTEETKKTNLENISQQISTFLTNASQTDSTVARTVRENQKEFFNDFPWLRPQNTNTEPSIWEQLAEAWGDFWGSVGDWLSDLVSNIVDFLKEHALEIIIGLVAIVIGAVLTWLTGGAFLAALLAGLKAAAISALISGMISGVIALFTGGEFWDAFGDGLASGFMWGGIFSMISSTITAIRELRHSTDLVKHFQPGTPQATKYPDGVKFTKGPDGNMYARFEPYAKAKVKFDKMTIKNALSGKGLNGNYYHDAKLANLKCGFSKTPTGYVWHHVEDMRTMILVPQDIHSVAMGGMWHKGGASLIKKFLASITANVVN